MVIVMTLVPPHLSVVEGILEHLFDATKCGINPITLFPIFLASEKTREIDGGNGVEGRLYRKSFCRVPLYIFVNNIVNRNKYPLRAL